MSNTSPPQSTVSPSGNMDGDESNHPGFAALSEAKDDAHTPADGKKRRILSLRNKKDSSATGQIPMTTTSSTASLPSPPGEENDTPLSPSSQPPRTPHTGGPTSAPNPYAGSGTARSTARPSTSSTPAAGHLSSSPTHSPSPHRSAIAAPLRSPSPHLLSPASSLIFERDVQESHSIPPDAPGSAAIPSHIQTEDHIPPVLEASSIAITNDELNPDEVEIVTHAAHTPAAVSVGAAGGGGHHSDSASGPMGMSPVEGAGAFSPGSLSTSWTAAGTASASEQHTEGAMAVAEDPLSYAAGAAGDMGDVRRLSFISFADVVQAEHAEQLAHVESGTADSMSGIVISGSPGSHHTHSQHSQIAGAGSGLLHMKLSEASTRNRSPSPVRSPASASSSMMLSGAGGASEGRADGGASPPTSGGNSVKGVGIGVAAQGTGGQSADIMVESLSSTLRKTGSGDTPMDEGALGVRR